MSEESEFLNSIEGDRTRVRRQNLLGKWTWGIVIGDFLGLVCIFALASLTADWNTWANVVAVGLVGIASVNGVILQVLIAGRMTGTMDRQEVEMTLQRKTSEKQWQSMQDALKHNETLIGQNSNLIEAAQRQADAADKALKQSEFGLTSSERAYISVRNIRLVKALHPDQNPVISMEISNGGRSPARNVTGNYKSMVNDRNHPNDLLNGFVVLKKEANEVEGRIGTLFAGESHTVGAAELLGWKEREEWQEALPKIRLAAVPLYVLCNINYDDFQDRHRAFQVIAFYEPSDDTFTECGSRELMFVGVHDTAHSQDIPTVCPNNDSQTVNLGPAPEA